MKKSVNSYGDPVYHDASMDDEFDQFEFHERPKFGDQDQFALFTNLGCITVVDRMTGSGWRDIETGFRDDTGTFWLASGSCDVRNSGAKTIGDAIQWIKDMANTCIAAKTK